MNIRLRCFYLQLIGIRFPEVASEILFIKVGTLCIHFSRRFVGSIHSALFNGFHFPEL